MSDAIDATAVADAARLARLALEPAEQQAMAAELERVRAWVSMLQAVDVSDVAPMTHPHEGAMGLRRDRVSSDLTAAEALANAPAQAEGHFLVPRVVG
ncbi:MAG: Asp-tRNA(Asn)/Glu-tRNA(Gln) amidotransferase subunit GatC [Myxococcales bacterium]|nr:Asp-tRNA(Asn)/Glu-tRNA(Gln) amidotransferase subunit GatC [Myxococcales bacterium]